MPSSEYTSAGGGLKLKGAKNAGIDKKKKKKKSKATAPPIEHSTANDPTALERDNDSRERETSRGEAGDSAARELAVAQKTEAERRHEEQRKKKLEQRLRREGIKTHKEKVEELNNKLSKLTDHNDMPRIGPG